MYEHTQIGTLMICATIFTAIVLGIVIRNIPFNIPIIVFSTVIILIISSFTTLTVTIDKKYMRIKYGYGLFRKKFPLKDLKSAKAAKNHWYYGWGIRYWPFRRMWIFNVSGFDAVEIEKKNGRVFRIGTNEPKKLEKALKKAI